MKKLTITLGVLGTLLFTGCGSMYSVGSNGKFYRANNSNCPKSRIVKGRLYCYKKDKLVGILNPVHPNVVRDYRYKQEQQAKSIAAFSRSMDSMARTQAINNLATSNYYSKPTATVYQTNTFYGGYGYVHDYGVR